MKTENRYTQKIITAINSLVIKEPQKIDDSMSNRLIDAYVGFKNFTSPLFLEAPFKLAKLTKKVLKNMNEDESFSVQIPHSEKNFIVKLRGDVHFHVVRINDKFIFAVFKKETLSCIFELEGDTINGILREEWVEYDHIHFIILVFFITYKAKRESLVK